MMRTLCLLLLLLALPATALDDVDAGRKLLGHYGWTCDSNVVEMTYTVPAALTGIPEKLYQEASRDVDLDLRPVLGKDVRLVRYTLDRRSSGTNSRLYAHVAFFKTDVVGAWLSTDAPIAPGVSSLDDLDFGTNF